MRVSNIQDLGLEKDSMLSLWEKQWYWVGYIRLLEMKWPPLTFRRSPLPLPHSRMAFVLEPVVLHPWGVLIASMNQEPTHCFITRQFSSLLLVNTLLKNQCRECLSIREEQSIFVVLGANFDFKILWYLLVSLFLWIKTLPQPLPPKIKASFLISTCAFGGDCHDSNCVTHFIQYWFDT